MIFQFNQCQGIKKLIQLVILRSNEASEHMGGAPSPSGAVVDQSSTNLEIIQCWIQRCMPSKCQERNGNGDGGQSQSQSQPLRLSAVAAVALQVLCLLTPPSTAAPTTDALTAYDVLKSYDFPVGLLPKGVTGYEIDRANGAFKAHLNGSCSFTISGYELKYRDTITGRISRDRLSDLKGVSVKILFFWVNIIEVTRNGGR
ncbi:hypothetical protein Sjap_006867 [Stephania japonica]|uniref:Uncharacterized protein n=1 Tax=Stephania japonica TaxID=461633 RepID=A0AAP0PLH2_9MAGN